MSKAQTIDLVRRRFNTYGDELVITSSTTGAAVDITGCSFVMYVYAEKTPDEYTEAVFSILGAVLDGPGGRVEFVPTFSQATQPDSTLFHEVVMTDTALRTRTVAIGKYVFY